MSLPSYRNTTPLCGNMTDRVGGDSNTNSGIGIDKMKPKKWMYTQRKIRVMFGRTLTWQRRLNGDANGDEAYNINKNNLQGDAGKKDNQDKNKANDDHDHKYIEYDDKQDDAAKWTIKTKIKTTTTTNTRP